MRFNLILGFFWLFLAVPLLVVNMTGKGIDPIEPGGPSMTMGALALILALYNFARWSAVRMLSRNRAKKLPPPPAKRRVDGPTLEYNPEFDFTRPGPQTLKSDDDTQRA